MFRAFCAKLSVFCVTQNGKRMPESSRWKFIVEEDHYTLLIYETSVEDEGLYECVAVNKMGKATCCARLVVQGALELYLIDI